MPVRPDDVTLDKFVASPSFQSENQPIRTVRVAILIDHGYNETNVRAAIIAASESLTKQVGIALRVVSIRNEPFASKDKDRVFSLLEKFETEFQDYDIGIAFVKLPRNVRCVETQGVCAEGITRSFRDIYLVTLNTDMIVHEVGHVFIRQGQVFHPRVGVMAVGVDGSYFRVEDRAVILRNKWLSIRGRDGATSPAK
jgi:hypothetical protein